jgi:uncharacterized membrane protein (DUF106 family)
MSKRKQYLIDKEYQLKTTFSIIGIVAVIVAILIVIIGTSIVINNRTMDENNININANNEKIKNINEIQDNIVHFLSSRSVTTEDKIYKRAIRDVAKNHVANMKKMKEIMTSNDAIMNSNAGIMKLNNYLLVAIIILIIAGTAILYVQLIRRTHRVSGPIYVMTMYMKSVLEGKFPDNMRELRDTDELKNFYNMFRDMINMFKIR